MMSAVGHDVAADHRRVSESLERECVRHQYNGRRRLEFVSTANHAAGLGARVDRGKETRRTPGRHSTLGFPGAHKCHVAATHEADGIESALLLEEGQRVHARQRPSVGRRVALINADETVRHAIPTVGEQRRVCQGKDRGGGTERPTEHADHG